VFAFDTLAIRMRLAELTQTQVAFTFDYVRLRDEAEERVASGQQRVLCMRAGQTGMKPVRVPSCLRQALAPFQAGGA
jgi:enediyne biosynthesis thioesterase